MSIFNRAMVVIWSLFSAAAVAEADWVLRGGTVYSMDETATHCCGGIQRESSGLAGGD